MARLSGRNKGFAGLALLACLGLLIGVIGGPAASASGGGKASIAKKKACKKKKKATSAGKRRRKCKKKTTVGAQSLVRATLTWDTGVDLDLWVFDSNGRAARASTSPNPIPSTTFSANDTDGLGPETFTDNNFNPKSAKNFSFGVCQESGGSTPTQLHLDYVTADGVHHTGTNTGDPPTHNGDAIEEGAGRTFNGGVPIPASWDDGNCKAFTG